MATVLAPETAVRRHDRAFVRAERENNQTTPNISKPNDGPCGQKNLGLVYGVIRWWPYLKHTTVMTSSHQLV